MSKIWLRCAAADSLNYPGAGQPAAKKAKRLGQLPRTPVKKPEAVSL